MDLERGRVIEIVVSVSAVAVFVAILVAIGLRYNEADLNAEGGLALVGAIALFVLVMGVIGYLLANVLND